MNWAVEELQGIDPGNRRRDKQAMALLGTLSSRPTIGLSGTCAGWSEPLAAYRFFDNDAITWDDLLAPHWSCSKMRMARPKVVLMPQDTIELDFNGQGMTGLGPELRDSTGLVRAFDLRSQRGSRALGRSGCGEVGASAEGCQRSASGNQGAHARDRGR